MRKLLMASSAALILPTLSACSYMPSWMGGSSGSSSASSAYSYDYDSAAYAEGSVYNMASTYGQANAGTSYAQASSVVGNYSDVSYASNCGATTYVQSQPCASTVTTSYEVSSPSTLVSQNNMHCNNIGCSPSNVYSVYGDNYYAGAVHKAQSKPSLRGSYKSDYLYGNLGGVAYDVGEDSFGVIGRVGYQSPYYVGAEIEGSLGVSEESVQTGGTTLTAGPDYSVGAFALARLPLGKRFSVHARGGYHVTKVATSLDNGVVTTEASEAYDGLAYGAGAEFNMSDRNSLRVDYTRYDYDTQTLNGYNIGPTDSVSVAFARKF